jgi:hypothetical protein
VGAIDVSWTVDGGGGGPELAMGSAAESVAVEGVCNVGITVDAVGTTVDAGADAGTDATARFMFIVAVTVVVVVAV